jgi:hypothetical protein
MRLAHTAPGDYKQGERIDRATVEKEASVVLDGVATGGAAKEAACRRALQAAGLRHGHRGR